MALAGASTRRESSHEAAICIQLAAHVRGLGYRAVASISDIALESPWAIKAGLGQYRRNQMVLTREFSRHLSFPKVFTHLPLVMDAPRKLGLATYCQLCTKCAEACPPKALPQEPPDFGPDSPSTIRGVKKWSADCDACFANLAKILTD